MEVLTHVNKRLKSRPMVQLPIEALLQQYQTTDSTFLHNFSIIYITMGFPRMTQDQQVKGPIAIELFGREARKPSRQVCSRSIFLSLSSFIK